MGQILIYFKLGDESGMELADLVRPDSSYTSHLVQMPTKIIRRKTGQIHLSMMEKKTMLKY